MPTPRSIDWTVAEQGRLRADEPLQQDGEGLEILKVR